MANLKKIGPDDTKPAEKVDLDKDYLFQQYKLTLEGLNSTRGVREASNNFFYTANSLLISGVGFLQHNHPVGVARSNTFSIALMLMGIVLCYSWLNVIFSYQKTNNMSYALLKAIEEKRPQLIMSGYVIAPMNKTPLKEVIIPVIFLIGYLFYMASQFI